MNYCLFHKFKVVEKKGRQSERMKGEGGRGEREKEEEEKKENKGGEEEGEG